MDGVRYVKVDFANRWKDGLESQSTKGSFPAYANKSVSFV